MTKFFYIITFLLLIGFPANSENKTDELDKQILVKVRSTGRLLKANIDLNEDKASIELLEDEYGISPGQACVFYSKNKLGYKVLGGGWITN